MKAKIKLISLIIIIGIIMLIFPKCVNAKIVELSYSTPVIMFQNSSEGITLEDFIGSSSKGYYAYELHGTHIFANEFIFCVKPEQSILGGEYYYSNEKYILKEGSVEKTTKLNYKKDFNNYTPEIKNEKNSKEAYNFARGLAYILSFYKDSNYSHDRSGDGRNKGPLHDEVNLALWAYLDYVRGESQEAKNFFGIESQGDVDIDSRNKTVSMSLYGDYEESTQAYKLYIEAKAIFDGDKSYKITGEFYKLTDLDYPGQSQELVFPIKIEVTEEPEVPEIKLDFYKVDYGNNKKGLSGAELKIEKVSNVNSISKTSIKSAGTTGKFDSIIINPNQTNPGTVKIKITETKAPDGYGKLSNSIELTITYNKETGEVTGITENSDYITTNKSDGVGIVYVKNKLRKITNLTILKTDIAGTNKLQGTKFTLYLNNIKSIKIGSKTFTLSDMTKGQVYTASNEITLKRPDGDDNNNVYIYGLTINSNGEIIIPEIMADSSDIIYTTITEEKSVVGYKKLPTSLRLVLRYDGQWKLAERKGEGNLSNELDSKYWELDSGNNLKLKLKNEIEVIELSGQVWIDGQKGEKNAQSPDGLKNDEKYLEGINVKLYSVKDEKIVKETITDKDGKYAFKEIQKTAEGYKVLFEYNGILYEDIGIKGDSKAKEADSERTALNNKFKTIDVNGSNDKTTIEYAYNKENNTSKFKATITGSEPKNTEISAQTEVCIEGAKNIDCGLIERAFDLAIGTDVKEAKLKINEKEITYNYAQIMNESLADKTLDEILQNKSSDNKAPVYNLYLYQSDYNYRIADYKTDVEGNKAPDKDNNGIADYDNLSNLQAFVTYSVILKNQTTHVATVDEFAYYYNSQVYTPTFAKGDTIDGYKVENIEGNKITFVSVDTEANKLQKDDFRKELNITFIVNKDPEGNIILKDGIRNVAEIVKYSTLEGGLIDKDSQPGNANVTIKDGNPTVGKYEDDTDEAKGINISIKKEEKRAISGTVFEDIDVDGLNDDSKAVNDVIIQLIEIKNIGGTQCEYIWQETRSGNSEVRIVNKDGVVEKYQDANKDIGDGQYKFTDFIPGNYIIRFIYGDGRTWDVTPKVQEYNGLDYQSTIYEKYAEKWYSEYKDNDSVATDNESRRLGTMAYTVEVDGPLGAAIKSIKTDFNKLTLEEKILISEYYTRLYDNDNAGLKIACKIEYGNEALPNKEDSNKYEEYYRIVKQYALQKTWMCAETAKVNITLDTNGFADVNFGLRKRPEVELTVEKHITALKITPTGVGVQPIVDARVNIDDILSNNISEDTKTGITTGLAIIPSTRTERGFWKVETDIEELAQGAKLEVEYTYVIKNNSEPYYLSTFLLNEYKNNIGNLSKYKETLENKSGEAKSSNFRKGTFLGAYYYTNKPGTEENSNLARVDGLEEALNNKLSYNESISGEAFEKINTTIAKRNYYNNDGILKELDIETILATKSATEVLGIGATEKNRTLKLETTISSLTNGKIGATIPSYITQVTSYSNAAGIINKNSAAPGNLAYIHCDDKEISLDTNVKKDSNGNITEINGTPENGFIKMNEYDEFWGETIIISKPTGQDKNTILIITAITISSIAVIGVSIILIKKHVLKK